MVTPQSDLTASNLAFEQAERFEVIDGEHAEREPMGAFETVLASWLCHLLNEFAVARKLGLAVTEVLFTLDAARDLKRRPDVAFVAYARWPEPTIAREPAWHVAPDLAVEIVSPTNLAEEIDGKVTDYFQSGVRLVWVIYPHSARIYVYQSPTHVQVLQRADRLDGGGVLPGFEMTVERLYEAVTKPE